MFCCASMATKMPKHFKFIIARVNEAKDKAKARHQEELRLEQINLRVQGVNTKLTVHAKCLCKQRGKQSATWPIGRKPRPQIGNAIAKAWVACQSGGVAGGGVVWWVVCVWHASCCHVHICMLQPQTLAIHAWSLAQLEIKVRQLQLPPKMMSHW